MPVPTGRKAKVVLEKLEELSNNQAVLNMISTYNALFSEVSRLCH